MSSKADAREADERRSPRKTSTRSAQARPSIRVAGRIKARTWHAAPQQRRDDVAAEKSCRSRDEDFQNRNSSAVKAATKSLTSTICRAEIGRFGPGSSAS